MPCVNPALSEIIRAQARAGFSDAQCAEICCVSEFTWRRWIGKVEDSELATSMPAGAWKLFRYELGMLELKPLNKQ